MFSCCSAIKTHTRSTSDIKNLGYSDKNAILTECIRCIEGSHDIEIIKSYVEHLCNFIMGNVVPSEIEYGGISKHIYVLTGNANYVFRKEITKSATILLFKLCLRYAQLMNKNLQKSENIRILIPDANSNVTDRAKFIDDVLQISPLNRLKNIDIINGKVNKQYLVTCNVNTSSNDKFDTNKSNTERISFNSLNPAGNSKLFSGNTDTTKPVYQDSDSHTKIVYEHLKLTEDRSYVSLTTEPDSDCNCLVFCFNRENTFFVYKTNVDDSQDSHAEVSGVYFVVDDSGGVKIYSWGTQKIINGEDGVRYYPILRQIGDVFIGYNDCHENKIQLPANFIELLNRIFGRNKPQNTLCQSDEVHK